MCLVALALGQSQRFPLVLASNRDEFFDRPTAALDWSTPPGGGPAMLAGRDLKAGGTWLGLTAAGRLALVTNVRAPSTVQAAAPSRGELVPRWLRGESPFDAWWSDVQAAGYNGFNLVAADLAQGEWTWASNTGLPARRLAAGLYAVSNAALDTPWPKTERLKRELRAALRRTTADEMSPEALAARLFDALADRRIASDAELPATGIPLARERELSAAFIRTTDGRYGTRCSIVVISERVERRSITYVFERTFDGSEQPTVLRRTRLLDWPPLPGTAAQTEAVALTE